MRIKNFFANKQDKPVETVATEISMVPVIYFIASLTMFFMGVNVGEYLSDTLGISPTLTIILFSALPTAVLGWMQWVKHNFPGF